MKEDKNPWNKANQWEEELGILKSIIDKTELEEMTKWGGPVYTINKKNVVGIGGFKSYVGIWFFNGVFLKDEKNVLVNANEGVTRGLRQWRFESKDEILKNEKFILHYINEAIANEKAGLVIKPEKKEEIVSELLNAEFKSDGKLKTAFEAFTPYKQREFLEYVESAKQEKTKLTRIEKIKPMILEGKGLNDKYR
ncbi:YdeI/OmpD-associated family protein [Flavobacterium enshiense]|uniref:YdeI/OmpD-associated family protein n=1 Tax=Flavobacterium enshiense TaxID=1341165 RepID=UPI00345DB289